MRDPCHPLCDPRSTRNNIPVIIPHPIPTSLPTSEGEGIAATSEGETLTTYEGKAAQDWHSTPREKRKITRVKKTVDPKRKSARLNKNMNLPSDRNTVMEKNKDTEDKYMQGDDPEQVVLE